MHRRALLGGALALSLGAGLPGRADSAAPGASLGALAREKGLFFGSAVTSDRLNEPGRYRDLLIGECDVWATEWELKWGALEHAPGRRDYSRPDLIMAAAAEHGKRMRGHTLLWHSQLPTWLGPDHATSTGWSDLVEPYLIETLRRYEGQVFQWDVVNEPFDHDSDEPLGLRRTPFFDMIGYDYLARSFEIARATAPTAKLYLNDFGLSRDVEWHERRRNGVLRLLEKLLSAGVPIDGIGIQAHQDADYPFSARKLSRFLEECAQFGLEIVLTELDVMESLPLAGTIDRRDQRVAEVTREVARVALDQPALRGIVAWGLSDRFSWLQDDPARVGNRGLPYDAEFQPKPMRDALADAFRSAPPR